MSPLRVLPIITALRLRGLLEICDWTAVIKPASKYDFIMDRIIP